MKKVILHSGGQGCHGVLEDVYRLVSTEADGGIEWKYPISSAESESVLIRHRKALRKRQGKNQSKKMNRLYFADER